MFNYVWYELLNLALDIRTVPIPCWYSFCILGLWPIFTGLGIFTQRMATAREYKQKVERVHVPRTAQNIYGTIRRTIDRSRGRADRSQDQYVIERQNGASRSAGQNRSRSEGSSDIPSRASRNRDRARQQRQRESRRPRASAPASQNEPSDRQRLLQSNENNSRRENSRRGQSSNGQVSLILPGKLGGFGVYFLNEFIENLKRRKSVFSEVSIKQKMADNIFGRFGSSVVISCHFSEMFC